MSVASHLDGLNTQELVVLIFLADQDKPPEHLQQLINNRDFIESWRQDRERLSKLVEHYPNVDEERHFLIAMLEAAHGFNSFSSETLKFKESVLPFINFLVALD